MFNLNELSQQTIQKFEELFKSAPKTNWAGIMMGNVEKAIDTTTGLVGVNLEAPAALVTPFLSPLNNRIPRDRSRGGTSVQFKRITAYTSPGTSLGVAEKTAAGAASITSDTKVCSYKSYGLRDQVSWESVFAGANFQDPKALATMLLLNRIKVEEDKMQLYANAGSGALGYAFGASAPAAPTLVLTTGGTGTITTTTTTNSASVKYMALTGLGYWGSSLTAISATGRGPMSTVKTTAWAATTTTGLIKGYTTPVKGAVGYAWFVETNVVNASASDTTKRMEFITTQAEFIMSADSAGTGQVLSTVTTNTSDLAANALDFDGMYGQMTATGSGADHSTLGPNTTSTGLGTPLTHDGGGGITQINTANKNLWNTQNVGANLILMNAQEIGRISDKLLGAGGSYILRVTTNQAPDGNITAGGRVNALTNKSIGGEQTIIVHPKVVPGNILGITEQLPYPNSNITSVLAMDLLADYTLFDYFMTTVSGPVSDFEIRLYGAMKDYFPASQFSILNVGDVAIT